MLRNILQRSTRSILYEADHGLPIETGKVYLAPADYHLTIDEDRISLSKDLPVAHARPSINLAFESASRCYGTEAIGVILTGTGSDGAAGLAEFDAVRSYCRNTAPRSLISRAVRKVSVLARTVRRKQTHHRWWP
jgi:chemotaxis response regulator CheB